MAYKRYVTCDGCGQETTDSNKDNWSVSISNFLVEEKEEDLDHVHYDLCLGCTRFMNRKLKETIELLKTLDLDDNGFNAHGN